MYHRFRSAKKASALLEPPSRRKLAESSRPAPQGVDPKWRTSWGWIPVKHTLTFEKKVYKLLILFSNTIYYSYTVDRLLQLHVYDNAIKIKKKVLVPFVLKISLIFNFLISMKRALPGTKEANGWNLLSLQSTLFCHFV